LYPSNKEIYLSRKEANLDNYLLTLSEDYGLTFEKAKSSYVLELDVNEARSKVDTYKNIIKNIGMVNVNSISEYKEVKERFDFLNNERTDLSVAKETLLEIIDEMDEVMKKDFSTTFDKVRIEFKKVFKELFGGGDADLRLTDKDNLLETGIDIMASPPGKKLKTISLMSG
jgi:chromosome segregation protein